MNESGKITNLGDGGAGSLEKRVATLQKENRELKESLGAIYEQAQESEKIYRTIIDLSFDSCFVQTDGEIVFINQPGAKCIGFHDNKNAIGKKFLDYVDPDYHDLVVKLQKEALKEGTPSKLIEIKMMQAGGSVIDVEMAAAPFVYNDKKALLIVSRDISKRKQAEEKLKEAKEQAEKATKLKDKFVSLVAHDLRSPFTSIVGLLRLMYDDVADPLSPGHRELMNHVLDNSAQQIKMIEELLNISRLQTGHIVPKKRFLDGALFAGAVIENLGYIADRKGIVIKSEIPAETMLYADLDLFNEALQNLVSNAIKFCKKGDTITLFLPPGRNTTIGVKDTGPGIEGDLLPKLFKHEERSSTMGTAGEKGSGLGLPFCHDIMNSHGGRLTVETKPGEGSLFLAELPYEQPKILIVDDQPEVTSAIKKSLKTLDVEFLEAGDGEKGLEIIEKNRPHIIIADMDMPLMDGFEFIKKIREKYDHQSIPIIVTTKTFVIETKERALRLGANDFAMKPIKGEEFLPRVKRFLM